MNNIDGSKNPSVTQEDKNDKQIFKDRAEDTQRMMILDKN